MWRRPPRCATKSRAHGCRRPSGIAWCWRWRKRRGWSLMTLSSGWSGCVLRLAYYLKWAFTHVELDLIWFDHAWSVKLGWVGLGHRGSIGSTCIALAIHWRITQLLAIETVGKLCRMGTNGDLWTAQIGVKIGAHVRIIWQQLVVWRKTWKQMR